MYMSGLSVFWLIQGGHIITVFWLIQGGHLRFYTPELMS